MQLHGFDIFLLKASPPPKWPRLCRVGR